MGKNTHRVSDPYLAGLLVYQGLTISRVDLFGGSPVFFIDCPQFDYEIISDEFKSETSTLANIPAFVLALKKVNALLELARPSGVWQKKV